MIFRLTTHLLGNHYDESSEIWASNTGNGEQLNETADESTAMNDLALDLQLGMDVVDIPCHLYGVVSEQHHGLPCLLIAVLLHIPPW
jgi:hypothetical protein